MWSVKLVLGNAMVTQGQVEHVTVAPAAACILGQAAVYTVDQEEECTPGRAADYTRDQAVAYIQALVVEFIRDHHLATRVPIMARGVLALQERWTTIGWRPI